MAAAADVLLVVCGRVLLMSVEPFRRHCAARLPDGALPGVALLESLAERSAVDGAAVQQGIFRICTVHTRVFYIEDNPAHDCFTQVIGSLWRPVILAQHAGTNDTPISGIFNACFRTPCLRAQGMHLLTSSTKDCQISRQ